VPRSAAAALLARDKPHGGRCSTTPPRVALMTNSAPRPGAEASVAVTPTLLPWTTSECADGRRADSASPRRSSRQRSPARRNWCSSLAGVSWASGSRPALPRLPRSGSAAARRAARAPPSGSVQPGSSRQREDGARPTRRRPSAADAHYVPNAALQSRRRVRRRRWRNCPSRYPRRAR
jgi:hypothetical protein